MLKRFGSGFMVFVLLVALLPSVAMAINLPQVQMMLDKSSIGVGDSATLTLSATGATDVYGSAVDVVFDPTVIEFVSSANDGLVSNGLTANQYFATTVQAALTATSERRSVITIRLGQQPGATGDGRLAALTFKGLKTGAVNFAVDAVSVTVQLVDSQGESISFNPPAAGVTLTVGTAGTAPSISSPADNSYSLSRTVAVSGSAAAGSSLVPVLDGVDQSAVTASGNSFSFNATFTADGTHTIAVRDSGSGLTSAVINVIVDTQGPALSVNDIPATVTSNSVNVSGTVSDANFDALYIQVNPTDATLGGSPVVVNNGSFSQDVTLTSPVGSDNVIRVTAVDKAGNEVTVTRHTAVTSSLPYLKLVPRSTSAGPGATVLVDVLLMNMPVDANGNTTAYGVEFGLVYPPNLLQANSTDETGNMYTGSQIDAFKSIDKDSQNNPSPGIIHWSMTMAGTGTPVMGNNKLTTISFTVKSSVAQAATAHVAISDVWQDGYSAAVYDIEANPMTTSAPVDADVAITLGGSISGKAVLMSRPETRTGRTDYTGYANTTVDVIDPISNTVVASTVTTTNDGVFTISNIPAGSYTVRFSHKGFLKFSILSVPVTVGGTTSLDHLSFKMRPGNLKDNVSSTDKVGGEDLVIFGQAYGAKPGEAKWNPDADLNDDTLINGGDLTILGQAWFKRGSTQAGSDQILTYTAPAP